jgi:hypothetical protein
MGILATRLHAALLGVSIAALALFLSIDTRASTITVLQPSLATFEALQSTYPDTLSCPCSQISTAFKQLMVPSSPKYHQVCSSFVVNPTWQAAFTTINFANESDRRKLPEKDFRYISPALLGSIPVLCLSSQLNVNSLRALLENSRMISALALPRKAETILHSSLYRVIFRTQFRIEYSIILSVIHI